MKAAIFIITFLGLMFKVYFLSSQIIQSTKFSKGSISDGQKIMAAYLLPVEQSFNAINRTGLLYAESPDKNKKTSFAIFIDMMAVITPNSDKTYDVNDLQLTEFKPSDPNNTVAQTFAGSEQTIQLESKSTYKVPSTSFPFYTTKPILTFNTPKGIRSTIPFAIIGFSFNTPSVSVAFRGLPPLSLPGTDGKVSQLGAVAHTKLNNAIPFLSTIPFDIILSGGFQYLQLNLNPNLKPDNSTDEDYNNQKFYIHSISVPLQFILSKTIKNRFNVFGGAGYNFANSSTGLVGTYPLYKSDPTDSYSITIDKIKDPIKYNRDNSALFLSLGLNYSFKWISFGGEFIWAKYKSLNLRMNVFL
ncbi:MAG: DUF6588 family protein [Desulfurella sp.]